MGAAYVPCLCVIKIIAESGPQILKFSKSNDITPMDNSTLFNATDDLPEAASRATLKLSLSIAYFILFIVGTIGNGIVIVMIINVLTSMRRTSSRGKRKSLSNTNHVFIYVLGLSIVDLVVIIHLPFLIVDLLKGQWLFGTAMCKLYWFGESISKLLSSFIMTVLSWDRYLAVCSPVKSMRIRSNCVALLVLLICSLLAFILLLPVLIQSSVYKIDRMTMMPLQDDTDEQRSSDLHGTTSSKCVFDSDAMFTLYTFMIGFAFPAILITMFYSRVICKVQQSSRNMRGMRTIPEQGKRDISAHRVQQVTKRIVAVILFYFLCWTPQWTLNIMTQFNLIHVSWMTPALSAMFFVAHLLVCFNSAANPVLYALINRELRQQHVMAMARKRQSFTHATHGALEFVARHTHKCAPGHHLIHQQATAWGHRLCCSLQTMAC
ncbi:hypothetical protein Y032_0199g1641 [Ancylostoma ceylanicum]|uniref:G-protein coupled receptors family 1 profile domain-containing protein n=2 Tax=Ancylostoma ceylanicum TaxID=53326 RepID=A0A016SNM6_9BILA|nr:hypothetical protein Y032_0199g1641 [Ancylostoma ceylanicum]